MALEAYLIKKPYEVSLTGNPMPYTFALAPYGSVERNQDIRFIARVMVENVFGSNTFDEVKSQPFYPNEKGEISFDVKKIVHAYLDYYTPNPMLQRPVQAIQQRKRYRVDYILQKDGAIVGTVEQTPILYAVKGGMAYDQWHPKEFFTSHILNKKMPLQFSTERKIPFDELRYFFWIYPHADMLPQTVMIDILLNDQTTLQHNLKETIFIGKWGVCCVPAGFNQLKLNNLLPPGATAISYTIQVKNSAGISIVAPFTCQLEQRNAYNAPQLLYRNSLGGMESHTLRGQVDFEADYAKQNIQSATPPNYFNNMVLMHQANDINTAETPRFKGDTGFFTREATDRLRDLFLSEQKYEAITGNEENNTVLLPVTIITKNTKFFSNNENLVTTLIEWQRAYVNEYYSPNRLMPTKRACPALESFNVTQINKYLLNIMYALESPYTRVKIEIETTLGIQTFYYTGNAGTVRQAFNNPVLNTLNTEEIEIRAYTVCDEFSEPMDLGPVSIVNLVVVGNTLPIANDDTYNISVGYNTGVVLNGSVLANDYDPDGDPIECVVQNAQASNEGGTYSIDIDGIITYQPPSSVWSGQDYFDYEINEVGSATTVTARVYINVGTVAGLIYAKVVQRNVVTLASGYTTQSSAEFWVDYFADPSATVPLDVTGMGITFHVNQHTHLQDNNCNTNDQDDPIDVAGVGTKTKFFEGAFYTATYDPGFPCDDITQLTFTLIADPAYVVI